MTPLSPAEKPVRVLLLEDDPVDAQWALRALSQSKGGGFQVCWVDSLAKGLDQLQASDFELVLSDLKLPDAFGMHICKALHDAVAHLPIVFLTGTLEEEAMAMEALQNGVQDYLLKGKTSQEGLLRSLAFAMERHRLQEAVRNLSLQDDLTGLGNRRAFLMLAQQQLKLANRTNKPLRLLMLDLDGFKKINDQWGHAAGDEALVETARLLEKSFRQSDIKARLGGDEFSVLAIECSAQTPQRSLESLWENLRCLNATPGRRFPLSFSVGAAVYDPALPISLDELFQRADADLYDQKRARSP